MLLRLTQHDDLATIQAWADRSIPGTFESSARSLRLRNRAWNISFDAGGRLPDLTGDFHPESAASPTKSGRAELTVEAFRANFDRRLTVGRVGCIPQAVLTKARRNGG